MENSFDRAPKPTPEIAPGRSASTGAKLIRKLNSRNDIEISSSDSSEEDIIDASTAPEPDADISYSFDAPRGPHHGSQILGMAIAKAVEKFETQATERLVKNEYEIVGKGNPDHHCGYTTDEDDFELIWLLAIV